MLARRDEGPLRRRQKYDSRAHGRDKCCPRIFNATGSLVTRICDWVCRIVLLSLNFQLTCQIPSVL